MKINAAVITVSSSRTPKTDESGRAIREILTQKGISISFTRVIRDDIEEICTTLKSAMEDADLLIFCGGTGLTKDDCTTEAISPLLEKTIDGFGELFRWMSYQEIGTAAMLSRAIAGTLAGRVIFCIPGSPGAAKLATERLIAPEAGHILAHVRRQV
ncbi:MAG: MogA/MoaB family molybdenum cofactor biosynthesis protein [Methanomicrobiales archaeon]|nr:MogA/MoaB family molybdenum cofactor biosynthesis protein [Methanomicrobiales archaeon]